MFDARDIAIAQWEKEHPDLNVFDDEDIEVMPALEINIDAQIAAVIEALEIT
jgi:hypothetical protein